MGRQGDHAHEAAENIRGTVRFGQTKTVVASASQISPDAPLMNVNVRPVYIPDFATPRFRLTPRHFAPGFLVGIPRRLHRFIHVCLIRGGDFGEHFFCGRIDGWEIGFRMRFDEFAAYEKFMPRSDDITLRVLGGRRRTLFHCTHRCVFDSKEHVNKRYRQF